MLEGLLEVKHTDLAARIGILETKHGDVEIPAFVPVIHPVKQAIDTQTLKKMGFKLVITNAYITRKAYGENAGRIHEIINFNGAVMTDSGGYQVLEYGDLDLTPYDIAKFEESIGSDIAIPLDRPTGFGLKREVAEDYVKRTLVAAEDTIKIVDKSKAIWVGPVQGGEYLDLVSYTAKRLSEMGYDMLALGSPTEVMESYEFRVLARMIIAAKTSIPSSKPFHLFGAGHPLTIPLAIALGCDTFDSASYMLYAKDDRYMLQNGTTKLQDLTYLPCVCDICSRYTATELRSLPHNDRVVELAKHNLYMIKREVDATKQAILDGRLWEYVMQKSMSHPKLMEANEVLIENSEYLEEGTPLYKDKALFLTNVYDQHRPEVSRFKKIVLSSSKNADTLLLIPEPSDHPLYANAAYTKLREAVSDNVRIAYYSPFLGIVPEELSDLYPAAHHVSIDKFKPEYFPAFREVLSSYISKNKFQRIAVIADEFMRNFLNETAFPVTILDYESALKL